MQPLIKQQQRSHIKVQEAFKIDLDEEEEDGYQKRETAECYHSNGPAEREDEEEEEEEEEPCSPVRESMVEIHKMHLI